MNELNNMLKVGIEATDLQPKKTKQKSYYGKARVIFFNGVVTLYSYETQVVTIKNGEVTLYNTDLYSVTTLKHVKDFLYQNNIFVATKKDLLNNFKIVY